MLKPRIIPTLLLKGRGLVKGEKFKDHRYVGDPINAVKIFNDKKADELVFLDITATSEGRIPDLKHIQEIADEAYMPFAVGGGLRTVEDVGKVLRAGAEKVCINTACVEKPEVIGEAASQYGNQSIVASIDARKKMLGGYEAVTHSGKKKTGLNPVEHAGRMVSLGAGEVMITSIQSEGGMQGYDLELVKEIAEAVDVPVIASGGAGNTTHLKEAIKAGASAAAAGSMLVFHGKRRAVLISYPEGVF